MIQEKYNIIGVMSGTSLDGIDLAHLNFEIINGKWNFQILESETIGYSQEWIDQLKIAIGFSDSELLELNKEYTLLLGNIISEFIAKHHLESINAVCSHGHTILHQPKNGFTLQIGSKTINYQVDSEVEGKKGLDISEKYVYYEEYCDGFGRIEIQISDPKSLVPHEIKGGLIQSLIDKDKKIFHIYKKDKFQGKIDEYDESELNTGMFEM